jgi:hypothetical protein
MRAFVFSGMTGFYQTTRNHTQTLVGRTISSPNPLPHDFQEKISIETLSLEGMTNLRRYLNNGIVNNSQSYTPAYYNHDYAFYQQSTIQITLD